MGQAAQQEVLVLAAFDTCAKATVIMGSLWGQRAPTTTHAETIYAEIVLAPGGALPIDAEALNRVLDHLPPGGTRRLASRLARG